MRAGAYDSSRKGIDALRAAPTLSLSLWCILSLSLRWCILSLSPLSVLGASLSLSLALSLSFSLSISFSRSLSLPPSLPLSHSHSHSLFLPGPADGAGLGGDEEEGGGGGSRRRRRSCRRQGGGLSRFAPAAAWAARPGPPGAARARGLGLRAWRINVASESESCQPTAGPALNRSAAVDSDLTRIPSRTLTGADQIGTEMTQRPGVMPASQFRFSQAPSRYSPARRRLRRRRSRSR